MKKIDLTNRRNCFYWQTDRNLTPEDYQRIFLRRHELPEEEILQILKAGIKTLSIKSIQLIPADENMLKGNVNIVRKILINNVEYVVRMHPQGVKNGYFHVEKVALELAKQSKLPVPQVLEIHQADDEKDMDFVLLTVSPGTTMDVFLSKDPSNEHRLLFNSGVTMASIHTIPVEGFGFFDNQIAKTQGILIGLQITNMDFIMTALEENFQRLITLSVSTPQEIVQMRSILEKYSCEPVEGSRLIHNDFADWNLLTDGKTITGILDWDECYGGDPIADLACWSTFFELSRYKTFLEGYTSIKTLPDDYEKRFHYYRLRYTISKMALRAKRALVDNSDFIKDKLFIGKKALNEELQWFNR